MKALFRVGCEGAPKPYISFDLKHEAPVLTKIAQLGGGDTQAKTWGGSKLAYSLPFVLKQGRRGTDLPKCMIF